MTQFLVHKDGKREENPLMSVESIERLKTQSGVTDDVDVEIHRLSKWGVKVNLVSGMALHASFKFNVRTHSMKRLV